MEKRLIFAVVLSSLVLMFWSGIFSPAKRIAVKEVAPQNLTASTPLPPPAIDAPLVAELEQASTLKYENKNCEITFIENYAAIKEITFKNFQNHKMPLGYGFLFGGKDLNFKKDFINENQARFVQSDSIKKISKDFIFSKTNNTISLEINVQSESATPLVLNLPLVLGIQDFTANNAQTRYQDMVVAVAAKEKPLYLSPRKNQEFSGIRFLGLRDRYFCAIISPDLGNYTAVVKTLTPQISEVSLLPAEIKLLPNQSWKGNFAIYLGPQDLRIINSLRPEWSAMVNFGFFDFIAQLLLQLLAFLNGVFHNLGVAIILLSVVVYLVLYPLTLKQMRSMKEMQLLQPKIEELRKIYKDNAQKLNKEIMELYKKHKVNPFGGCLPLILQMPIFFALYQALSRSIALKGATFLWIRDLSEPDRLFLLPMSIPVLGNEINILPIVMAIGMFIQQKTSMVATSGTSAEQQKMMLIIMPVMFGFIFYHMPSGLVLYWLINSVLTLINQIRVSHAK
ncbi:MAG: YidC/Oxa1 family insertase periplasmic-domain containing protein [Candidatus Omnitrophota bacterium]